ncbi:30S ribosomal protein S6e [Cuniculiplasma sp. SKW3]|uniref:30S ribosomal protein S6e n=1 Tax=unclassified Cuniculiplasma TaxID=2619706 RepID=UPI003FD248D0
MAGGNSVAIIADKKTGKTYKKDVKPENLSLLNGRRIGEEIDGIFFELPGYKLKITGGSSIDGFPMKSDLAIPGKKRILVRYREGQRAKRGIRKRVTFRGSVIGPDISQLNFVITQYGPAPLEAPDNQSEEKKE